MRRPLGEGQPEEADGAVLLFVFNDTATTEIYTLSLHDALPIYVLDPLHVGLRHRLDVADFTDGVERSEEHTSELQSRWPYLVCRLLLEKKITFMLVVCASSTSTTHTLLTSVNTF